jgi:aspartyl-tRNA(Asn)/glutamyl-tRNA(Gln) amidotransferase subunit A
VAAGIGPFAIGSDGGGPVRIPSSFSGLLTIRHEGIDGPGSPLSGRQGRTLSGVSSWEALEHIGPMSRTVADGALMLSVIAGPDDRDKRTLPKQEGFDWMTSLQGDLKGLKIAYSAD